jgi:hypothetical protein
MRKNELPICIKGKPETTKSPEEVVQVEAFLS